MPKQFIIPERYRSPYISSLKSARRARDAMKRDLRPIWLDLGVVRFAIARHFGFCFGVENAIDIAYRAVAESAGRRVFLLSEMIHNEQVNADLRARGVQFLMTAHGEELIPFEELTSQDLVIIPAFGTTREIFDRLKSLGIEPQQYNATCPFVEKVWNRSEALGRRGYTIIIHGKSFHEETRATFSHAAPHAPSVIIRDHAEAQILTRAIQGDLSQSEFEQLLAGKFSTGFSVSRDLTKIGVVNQTTMLATETLEIVKILRDAVARRYGEESLAEHFADTRDTLCYATNENQDAVQALVEEGGDMAIVVGGYNSSNTSQLYKICRDAVPTFYVKDAGELISPEEIQHFDLSTKQVVTTRGWLEHRNPTSILITAGASCPDAAVDEILTRIADFFGVLDQLPVAVARATEQSSASIS